MATFLQNLEKDMKNWPEPPTTKDCFRHKEPEAACIVEIITMITNLQYHIAAAMHRKEPTDPWTK